uniref:Uncharacterized protein n=1 Tax=Arundo donax TaxID=35708 RepID=A0A0A9AY21_ARUDO
MKRSVLSLVLRALYKQSL